MGLGTWLGNQFIEIIEWTEPSQNDILAHRFTQRGHNNEMLCPLPTICILRGSGSCELTRNGTAH